MSRPTSCRPVSSFLSAVRNVPELFLFPHDMLPVPVQIESPERPGAGALLRARMERHRALTRRGFSAGADRTDRESRTAHRGRIRQRVLPARPQLRDRARFAAPKRQVKMPVVIVGGGMAGLSAAWRLDKRGFHDFVVLEMEPQAGGNSRSGRERDHADTPGPPTMCPCPPKASHWRASCSKSSASTATAAGTSAPSASLRRSAVPHRPLAGRHRAGVAAAATSTAASTSA